MGIRIFGGLGLVALLAAFLVPALVVWSASDLPGIDDADLVPPAWSAIEPERNAFTHFERAAALLPENDENDISAALEGDPEALAAFAADQGANAPALAVVPDILSAPEFEIPPLTDLDAEGPAIAGWQRVGQLVAVRGLLRGREGLEDLFVALELGVRLEGARGADFVEGVVSARVRRSALHAMAAWLGQHEIEAPEARRLIRRLAEYRSDPEAWHRIAGAEYDTMKRLGLRDLRKMNDGDFGNDRDRDALQLLIGRFYFQPNRTLQGFADRYRIVAENGGRICGRLALVPGTGGEEGPSPFGAMFSPNGGGKVLLAAGSPDFGKYHEQRCQMNSWISALQTMAALRAWQTEHGALPESLDALVPDLLAELPRDDFEDEPLRWDRERGWLHAAFRAPEADGVDAYVIRFTP